MFSDAAALRAPNRFRSFPLATFSAVLRAALQPRTRLLPSPIRLREWRQQNDSAGLEFHALPRARALLRPAAPQPARNLHKVPLAARTESPRDNLACSPEKPSRILRSHTAHPCAPALHRER